MRKEYELRGGRSNPYAERLGAAGRAALLERLLKSAKRKDARARPSPKRSA